MAKSATPGVMTSVTPFFGDFDRNLAFLAVLEKKSGEFILEPKETSLELQYFLHELGKARRRLCDGPAKRTKLITTRRTQSPEKQKKAKSRQKTDFSTTALASQTRVLRRRARAARE